MFQFFQYHEWNEKVRGKMHILTKRHSYFISPNLYLIMFNQQREHVFSFIQIHVFANDPSSF